MPTRRATRKKLVRKFKIGDQVTWGNGFSYHPVIRVTARGVYVNASPRFENHFLHFAPGSKSRREPGPPRLKTP